MRRLLCAYVAGVLFAVGLIVSGMTQPAKVIGFLDVTGGRGAWDPSLCLVMGGALLVYALCYRVIMYTLGRRGAPLFDVRFHLPGRRDVDWRLIGGAVLFGVGWGLSGYCPGPALVSVTVSAWPLIFVAAMITGMYIERLTARQESPGEMP